MSDHDTLPPEVDDEIRARLQTFARAVAEHTDTETALGRMPRRLRRRTIQVVAIAACLLAVVALAVVMFDRDAFDNTERLQSPTQTTDCPSTTRPRAITPGGTMKKRFAAPVATAATAIMLLGACSDDGPTTLATGKDVELVGNDGLAGQTLNISAQEKDGKVTGEFRVTKNVIALQCADTATDGVIVLGGKATAGPDVAVGDLLALIIREGNPDRVALFANDNNAGSCTELVKSIPKVPPTGESPFANVEDGYDIKTG